MENGNLKFEVASPHFLVSKRREASINLRFPLSILHFQSTPFPYRAGVAAGAAAAAGPPPRGARSVIVLPSGSVTERKMPPGSPFLNGLAVNLTLSPALTVVDFHPAGTRRAGDVI